MSQGAARQTEPQMLAVGQQDPLRQLWPEGQQAPLQFWEQHVPLIQVWVESQQTPLQQVCEQQSVFPLQLFPAVMHATHTPFLQIWVVAQQFAPV